MSEYVEVIAYIMALILAEIIAGLFIVHVVLHMPDETEVDE